MTVVGIYLNWTDYMSYLSIGGFNNTGAQSSDIIARDINGNTLGTQFFKDNNGITWKITGGNLTYNDPQC